MKLKVLPIVIILAILALNVVTLVHLSEVHTVVSHTTNVITNIPLPKTKPIVKPNIDCSLINSYIHKYGKEYVVNYYQHLKLTVNQLAYIKACVK